ncbi:hypothetical protein Tco_0299646 [Tanacetum coccineum]
MSGIVPLIPPPSGTNPSNAGSPNKVDTITNDNTNNTSTNNVTLNVVVAEDLPQLLDTRGGSHVINVPGFDVKHFSSWKDRFLVYLDAHEGPSDTRDTKIAALRLKFNAFKALEGEKDSDSDVEEETMSSSEFLADLNAEFQDRALLANQRRFYERSGRVGSTRKPMDKTNETCFTCVKQGHFQKNYPTTKTSTPSYPSSNKSYNKPKSQSNSSQQHNQNNETTRKDYIGKYKALKSEVAILTKKIDAMAKNKSEKGLVAESFDYDKESLSSEDEGVTRVRAFMAIAEDETAIRKFDARSGQWVEITMKKTSNKDTLDQLLTEQVPGNIVRDLGGRGKRKETFSSKEVVLAKADESPSKTIPEITSDSESECKNLKPLPLLPKLSGAEPIVKVIKKKAQTKSPSVPDPSIIKKSDSYTKKLLLTLMEEVKGLKEKIKTPSENSASVSQTGSSKSAKGKKKTWFGPCKHYGQKLPLRGLKSPKIPKPFIPFKYYRFNDHHSNEYEYYPGCDICGSIAHETANCTKKTSSNMKPRIANSIIVKRHGNTTYDVFRGRSHDVSYFYVFGCPVFIHNHKDHLGKFDEKADDGFFLNSLVLKHLALFPDDEFLIPRRKIPTSLGKDDYFLYVPAFDLLSTNNITILNHISPTAQDINSTDESPELSIVDDHPVYQEHDDSEPAETHIDVSESKNITISEAEPSPIIISPLAKAGVTTRSKIRDSKATSVHECLYVNFLSKIKPKKLVEALKEEGWVIAMQEELNQFKRNKGFRQEEGVDYDETFAPIAR